MGRFLAVAVVALVVTPGAAAATKVRFAVSLRATVEATWQEEARGESGGCEVVVASSGSQRYEVRSARATTVTLVARKGRLRGIAGTLRNLVVDVSGQSSTGITTCGQYTSSECEPGPATIAGATMRYSRYQPGVLRLWPFEAADLAGWRRCVPAALTEPAFPLTARLLAPIGERSLLKRRKVVATGSRSVVTHLAGAEESGELVRQLSWTLTFRRLGR